MKATSLAQCLNGARCLSPSNTQSIHRFAISILPSFVHVFVQYDSTQTSSSYEKSNRSSKIEFLDGMRGLAAMCVLIEHFALPFRKGIYRPFHSWDDSSLLQLPILRLFYSGSPMVCIFFVISGIVLSSRLIGLARERDWDGIYQHLESAIFRRGIRLFAPSLVLSMAIMLGTYALQYDVKLHIDWHGPIEVFDGFWKQQPVPFKSFPSQIREWLQFVFARLLIPSTWRGTTAVDDYADTRYHEYGSQLWTVSVEFWSSILLFVVLIATLRLKSMTRVFILTLLAITSMCLNRWDVSLFMLGSIIAHSRSFCDGAVRKSSMRELSWAAVFCFGLHLASFPETGGRQIMGFDFLARLSRHPRVWQSSGATVIVVAAGKNTVIRNVFASRLMRYLGKVSFALYLVHLPFLAVLGWRLVPLTCQIIRKTDIKDDIGLVLAFMLMLPILFWIADLFYLFVDKASIDGAKSLERYFKNTTSDDRVAIERLPLTRRANVSSLRQRS